MDSFVAFFMFAWFFLSTSLLASAFAGYDRLPSIVQFGPSFYTLGHGAMRPVFIGFALFGAVLSQLIVYVIASGSTLAEALWLYLELALAAGWGLYLVLTTRRR